MILIILGGALVGLAVALLVAPLFTAQPKLAVAMENFGSEVRLESEVKDTRDDWKTKIGLWGMKLPAVPMTPKASKEDLQLIGRSELDHSFQKMLYGFGVAGILIVAAIVLSAAGVDNSLFFLIIALGFMMGLSMPDRQARTMAYHARKEFGRGVGSFIELVATEVRRGAHVTAAVASASTISNDSWVFVRIRQVLTRAQYQQQQVWDALEELADEIHVPELSEAARIVRLSGKDGARIYEALRASGKNLRMRALSDEHEQANLVSARISRRVQAIVMVFLGMILTALVINISNNPF
ncbi:type II secretion system F family protein [Glutamicibacter arilaitensis]|uniref:type II secretion system F family protein n=1 Tax=Glutamicibacter arilaitensis TaxID=256701 RepID=UPI003FD5C8DF